MTQDFQRLLASPDYDFLRAHERLGNRMMILGLSGSYGYGTNREGSDIDLRGVTMQRASDLLGLTTFEQYTLTLGVPFSLLSPTILELSRIFLLTRLLLSDIMMWTHTHIHEQVIWQSG